MSKFEFERVYIKTEESFICKSEGEFNFVGWKNKNNIISSKIAIPEVQANWWIELKFNTSGSHGSVAHSRITNGISNHILDVKLEMDQHQKLGFYNGLLIQSSKNQNFDLARSSKPIPNLSQIDRDHGNVSMSASCNINLSTNNDYVNFNHSPSKNQNSTKMRFYSSSAWNFSFTEQNSLNARMVQPVSSNRNAFQLNQTVQDDIDDQIINKSHLNIQVSISIFRNAGVHENEVFQSVTSPLPLSWIFQNEKISRTYNDDSLKDFTFHVRDREFRVHKLVLSLASDAFRAMFSCGLDETKTNSATVKDCEPEIFEHLIKFIYDRKLPYNLPSVAVDLYKIAHLYQIEKLQEICLGYVIRDSSITRENALKHYAFAMEYDMEKLFHKTWDFIRITMLDIHVPCAPKKVEEIRNLLDVKSKYKLELQKFIEDMHV